MNKIRQITASASNGMFTYLVGASYPFVRAGDHIRHPDVRGFVRIVSVETKGSKSWN